MTDRDAPIENRWDPDDYDADAGFVADYGESVVALLDPKPGERILDLGCGTGHLTTEIAEAVGSGGLAVGIDQSSKMIEEARKSYPDPRFECADAREFSATRLLDGEGANASFDAVFSNAALHWIPESDQPAVARRGAESLVPGGRFVAEMGGRGNVEALVDAVLAELRERGHDVEHPWYFPTVGEHAAVLEGAGFEVRLARLFGRPTELDGEDGLRNWLDVFGDSLFADLSGNEREAVVAAVEDRLRDGLFDPESGSWTADYRRLRFVARRLE